MKKFAVISILLFFLLVACQKDKSEPGDSYYMKFKIDGVDKIYTGHLFARTDTTAGYVTLTILGANSATSVDDYLGIYLDNSPAAGPLGIGQYNDTSTSYTLLTTHARNSIEYEAGQSVAMDAAFYNLVFNNHFKLNITAMDGKTARGTFTGDYFADGDVQNYLKLHISDGEFFVKFQ